MVVRHRKKKNKMRGNRTHGGGNTKNRRGAGCRGGTGNAGGHKHKYSSFLDHFGNKVKLKSKKFFGKAISLEDLESRLEQLILKKKAKREDGKIIIDGKTARIARVFGNKELKEKLVLKNIKATENAAESIKHAGGSIELKKAKAQSKGEQ
ncbi:MAG: uL15 family ribosomal protein [Candidatus Diapherotrites archaeon]|nr:uL15 family ribosomal protein [Candidatus Diapherotrites archaeon]